MIIPLVVFFIIIFIFLVVYLFIFYKKKKQPLNKIAIYSCNFGNYRNELANGIDSMYFMDNVDYYFYTDDKNLTSKRWKIIQFPILKELDFINSYRLTSKYVKFNLPKELEKYNVIVWIDSKYLKNLSVLTQNKKINTIFDKLNTHDILHLKHNRRETIQEEIKETIRLSLENEKYGNEFLEKVKTKSHTFPLVDTGLSVRKNNEQTRYLFQQTYNRILEEKLKRDQNIYNLVIDEVHYPCEKIGFL